MRVKIRINDGSTSDFSRWLLLHFLSEYECLFQRIVCLAIDVSNNVNYKKKLFNFQFSFPRVRQRFFFRFSSSKEKNPTRMPAHLSSGSSGENRRAYRKTHTINLIFYIAMQTHTARTKWMRKWAKKVDLNIKHWLEINEIN